MNQHIDGCQVGLFCIQKYTKMTQTKLDIRHTPTPPQHECEHPAVQQIKMCQSVIINNHITDTVSV